MLKVNHIFVNIKDDLVTTVDGSDNQISQSVSSNKQVVIKENLELFSAIFHPGLQTAKTKMYFEELFLQFDVLTFESLKSQFTIPSNLLEFIKEVFFDFEKDKLIKKIKKRLLTSRYNKQIFKIERF